MTAWQRTTVALLGLSLWGTAPAWLTAQSADSASSTLSALVGTLPPASHARIATGGERWIGRLTTVSRDSLALLTETGRRSVGLAAIDTLWTPKTRRHQGLLAGAGFGALLFGLLQLGGNSSEDPGLNTRFGLVLLAGSTALGLLVDASSERWNQRYPSNASDLRP